MHRHQLTGRELGAGGLSGNFLVNGDDGTLPLAGPSTGLVYVFEAVEWAFIALRAAHSATDGMVVARSQNCTFTQCYVSHINRDGLVIDDGAGGNAFIRSQFGAVTRDSVVIRETAVGTAASASTRTAPSTTCSSTASSSAPDRGPT